MEYREFTDFFHWIHTSASLIFDCIQSTSASQHQRVIQPILSLAGGTTPLPVYQELAILIADNYMLTSTTKPIILIPGDERLTPEVAPKMSSATIACKASHHQANMEIKNISTEQATSQRNEAMLMRAFKPVMEKQLAHLVSWYRIPIQSVMSDLTLTNSYSNQHWQFIAETICADMEIYIKKLTLKREILFDCTVLGIGTDGHLAGIFGTELQLHATQNKTAGYFIAPQEPRHRMSLLPYILQNTRMTLILLHKKGKEHVVDSILNNQHTLFNQIQSKKTIICCYNNT